ncbi:MAG: aminotransferase class I/II-fold pyridoxal phosphate-dependent enzyme [Pelagibacterales bacterium]|nr:aminotransferase class I/II-fold pyridoxal phosphate-dependent enzyme [Pelagibacterales bacterium]
MKKIIPYGKCYIDSHDINEVKKSLKNSYLTSGPFVKKLENNIKKKLKVKYAVSCNSGTAALHLAFISIGLKKKDIVILPVINFVAASNILKMMDIKIIYSDVDINTGQITPAAIEECIKKNTLKKIKAIVTMPLGGFPENIEQFYKIKKKYNCFLIEDACHALGARYKFKNKFYYVGSCSHSDVATFSFHPLKSITSGEGGIITTKNKKLADKIKILRSHGFIKKNKKHWKYNINFTGFNYRLSDINCALASSQLKKLDQFIKYRSLVAKKYINFFKNYKNLCITRKLNRNIFPSWHLFIVNFKFNLLKTNKEKFLNFLLEKRILAQQHYTPIYNFNLYSNISKKNFKNASEYFKNSISLPIFYNMKKTELNHIMKQISNFFKINSNI